MVSYLLWLPILDFVFNCFCIYCKWLLKSNSLKFTETIYFQILQYSGSCKHWRRVQHISNEFWDQWRKEVLMTFQSRQKWNSPKHNCKAGDIVLLKEEAERNRWPMAKIIATYKGNDGFIQSVRLMLDASNKVDSVARYLEWPVNKL